MLISDTMTANLTLCLDFANTVEWHASDQPGETLHTYADLVAWAREAGLVSHGEADALLRTAQERPAEASRVLQQARNLREAIYRIFAALTNAETPAEAELAILNAALSQALRGARLVASPDGFTWNWGVEAGALDSMLGEVARSAGALLTSELRARVGQCADDRGCGYLFLDTSKNHSRRWCNMGDCGNRAKQRRHQRRKRTQVL